MAASNASEVSFQRARENVHLHTMRPGASLGLLSVETSLQVLDEVDEHLQWLNTTHSRPAALPPALAIYQVLQSVSQSIQALTCGSLHIDWRSAY